MQFQRTIKSEIRCKSIGLHSGRRVNMVIRPAGVDQGITFIRKDVPGENRIKAHLSNVTDTTLATTLGINGTRISTIEHLLSAFRGTGIDNATVEVDSAEVPIMDGSALPFVNLLRNAGTSIQNKNRKVMLVRKRIEVADGDGSACLEPCDHFKITYKIDYSHPFIGEQIYTMAFSYELYQEEICQARTFGFLRDVEYLQAKGLALGGSLKNAIVLDDTRIINKEGLRCPDELVKHKILDAIGDLFLLGYPVIGHFVARKSGHKLNNLLLKELISSPDNHEMLRYSKLESGVPASVIKAAVE
ncbi:MAG TPA: UDP-3-O-acyl-N-acetylglucosamine deacetylase [Syntrophales bacterium]|nr:UDP-3-O-acyl-N-acetylglucosamine deacetylase [Syntrophales bacterium]